jgi:hypothetical protein
MSIPCIYKDRIINLFYFTANSTHSESHPFPGIRSLPKCWTLLYWGGTYCGSWYLQYWFKLNSTLWRSSKSVQKYFKFLVWSYSYSHFCPWRTSAYYLKTLCWRRCDEYSPPVTYDFLNLSWWRNTEYVDCSVTGELRVFLFRLEPKLGS